MSRGKTLQARRGVGPAASVWRGSISLAHDQARHSQSAITLTHPPFSTKWASATPTTVVEVLETVLSVFPLYCTCPYMCPQSIITTSLDTSRSLFPISSPAPANVRGGLTASPVRRFPFAFWSTHSRYRSFRLIASRALLRLSCRSFLRLSRSLPLGVVFCDRPIAVKGAQAREGKGRGRGRGAASCLALLFKMPTFC